MRLLNRPGVRHTARARLQWLRRLGWMVAIWAGSVAAVGLVSWVLRLWLRP